MFGIASTSIALAYLLCIISTILCVIYGIVTWNKGGVKKLDEEDRAWLEEEKELEKEL